MDQKIAHELKSLHTAALDARNGYQEALEDAKGRGLSGLFSELIDLHAGNAEELRRALVEGGEQSDEHGSFMSVVHETIMDIRSLFGGLGASVLPGLIDGEQRNLAKYDKALEVVAPLPNAFRTLLFNQREKLAAKLVELKAERASAKTSAAQ